MLTATEFYPLTTALTIVLWIEMIVYLGTGLYEIFDDYYWKTPRWLFISGRLNTYAWYMHKKGHKVHATAAMVLGFTAFNGIWEGKVTRFEVELIFLSLALLVCSIFCMAPPVKKLLFRMLPMAPEFLLQIAMFVLFADLVRPEILGICILFNLWGIFIFFRRTSRLEGLPHTYEGFRHDMKEAGAEDTIGFYDKIMGYREPDISVKTENRIA